MDLAFGGKVGFCANNDDRDVGCGALDTVYLLAEGLDLAEGGFLREAVAGVSAANRCSGDGRT